MCCVLTDKCKFLRLCFCSCLCHILIVVKLPHFFTCATGICGSDGCRYCCSDTALSRNTPVCSVGGLYSLLSSWSTLQKRLCQTYQSRGHSGWSYFGSYTNSQKCKVSVFYVLHLIPWERIFLEKWKVA